MAARRVPTFDVFVGNLPSDANEKNIGKLFTPYGEIGGITVKESPKVKGPNNKYAFVKYLCEPDADRAALELDRMKVSGIEITVKRADKEAKKKNPTENQGRRGLKGSDTDSNDGFQGGGAVDQEKERETVMITHVESPITLWLQVVNDENTKQIFNITEQLAALCPAANPVTGMPDQTKLYGCLFTEDNMWYRCQVKQNLGTDKFKIQYIDYGNTEEVTLSSLVEIPASVSSIKGLALKIVLHNTRAKDLSDKHGIQFLKALTDNQMAQLLRTKMLADGTGHYGQVFIGGQSIAEAMIQAGYAHSRPSLSKTGLPQQQARTGAIPGLMDAMGPPGPQLMGSSMFSLDKGNVQHQQPQRERNTISPLGQAPANMGYQMLVNHQDSGKEIELQSELTKKRRELEKIRNEKDAALMQVEYMRSKVKILQDEFAASTVKLQENTLAKRINTVMSLSGKVRHLRDQFPTNSKVCLLEKAIKLCGDSDRVDNTKCTTLAEVGSSLAHYKAAQVEISKCKEQSELQDLIKCRDEARKNLHTKLNMSLDELRHLPLDARTQQIKDLQEELTTTYQEYLKFQIHDCPSIENLVSSFKSWKVKKDTEFTDVRTATDFCEGAVQAALAQVKERISVDTNSGNVKLDVDIDDLMKTYAHALQREMNVTDLVHGKDSNLIATVIASVRRELQTELAMLDNYQVLQHEFQSRKESIEPWLDEKPTFTEVQENRKQLRSFKSKLRHTLADKLDLEESGSEGELDSVKEEEEKIRLQLQAALVKSDSLLNEAATLASNFPEIIVQYPDLGIDTYLMYKGLVKSNRDIDHYTLTPGFRSDVHQSSFNGEPVFIQEFHVGGGEHCSKEDFVKHIVSYNCETNIVQAVFFSKNERQAYVQSCRCDGKLIESTIKENQWSAKELQQICQSLTKQVADLHSRRCIHGEINPQTVMLLEDNSVMLLHPDFSKPLNERLCKRYTTENGLVFQCPELQYSSPEVLSTSVDVYNLVLLIFWLHCPNIKPAVQSNGSPDTKVPNIDPSLQRLFDGLLSGKNTTRIGADQILQLDYFHKTLSDVCEPSPPPLHVLPVSTHEPVDLQPHVIRSTNEPMEIGVFRAEDFISAPGTEMAANSVDTDDSWTTQGTSSASSGSRVDSPSDAILDATKSDTSNADSLQTVIEADANSGGDATVISGNSSDIGDTLACVGDVKGNKKTEDVFSKASCSDYLPSSTEDIARSLSDENIGESSTSLSVGEAGDSTTLPLVGDNENTTVDGTGDSVVKTVAEVSDTSDYVTAEQSVPDTSDLTNSVTEKGAAGDVQNSSETFDIQGDVC